MKIRGTFTNQLSDVIQALSATRKTGRLIAEREVANGSSELGAIIFNNGVVTDASVGRLRGSDAFAKLSAWQVCLFFFQSTSLPAIPPPSPQQGREYNTPRTTAVLPENAGPSPAVSRSNAPYRAQPLQNVLPDFQRFGLSRIHRQLFLLIDGNRSSEILARLLGRNLQEVRNMLADLERAGLIHQQSA